MVIQSIQRVAIAKPNFKTVDDFFDYAADWMWLHEQNTRDASRFG